MLWLNLGSGDLPANAPWVNVDQWQGNRADVTADVRDLPWSAGSVERIYCGHVLEHLEPDEVVVALREMRRVLAPGGEVCIVGPDYDRALVENDPVLLSVIRDGGDRWPGDRHLWLSTETTALAFVALVFPNAEPVPIAEVGEPWPVVSHVWWQFCINAQGGQ